MTKEEALKRIHDEVIAPALARNYDTSGLRPGRGVLKTALTKAGAKGNVMRIEGNTLTVGVSYDTLPEARYAIEGRGEVVAKRAKALRFYDEHGKVVFRKRVGPAPAHDVVYLTEDDIARAQALAEGLLGAGVKVRRA